MRSQQAAQIGTARLPDRCLYVEEGPYRGSCRNEGDEYREQGVAPGKLGKPAVDGEAHRGKRFVALRSRRREKGFEDRRAVEQFHAGLLVEFGMPLHAEDETAARPADRLDDAILRARLHD